MSTVEIINLVGISIGGPFYLLCCVLGIRGINARARERKRRETTNN
jgi:hypothetical protein